MRGDFWTTETVARLKDLMAEGWSYARIGVELGCGRNAAIGKARRLGFAATAPAAKPIEKSLRGVGDVAAPGAQAAKVSPPKPAVVDLAAFRKPKAATKSLFELQARDCRYPFGDVGDADFGFCGAESVENSVYCAGHHRLCRRPADPEITRKMAAGARRAAA